MSRNAYEILGVTRDATAEAIRKAYRKLAKEHHPDLNPGKKGAETSFAELNAAYEILSDQEKRAAYDRGEINLQGEPVHPFAGAGEGARGSGGGRHHYHYHRYAAHPGAERYHKSFDFDEIHGVEDLFASFFTGGVAGQKAGFKKQAEDSYYTLSVSFIEAVKGVRKRLTPPDGKVLEVSIPPGVENGQRLRLKGQGGQGSVDHPPGDAYVEILVEPHPYFTRKGYHLYLDLPVALHEAILGAKIEVPTLEGKVRVTLPKGVKNGHMLRLKGKGVHPRSGEPGDLLATVKIIMPDKVDEELEAAIRRWQERQSYNPRHWDELV